VASASVRAIITISRWSCARVAEAARIRDVKVAVFTSTLLARWPQRLVCTWSSGCRAATPALMLRTE
jgi:hypothetical protein